MPGLPFDEKKGIIPNEKGRILIDGKPAPGLYSVGWIKRGPKGVLGSNKPDGVETIQWLIQDLETLQPCLERNSEKLQQELKLKGVRVISFKDWKKLDAVEVEQGKKIGKPREKLTSIHEMLKVLKNSVEVPSGVS